MACRKCGSDWKTATGRDCQSCPHCNKIQRHLARKAGRWVEVTEQATCKKCGKQFTNAGANVGKNKCCSQECSDAFKKTWRKAYNADYRGGRRRGTQANRRLPRPACKRCGTSFKRKYGGNNANMYCSKNCFFQARNAGDHAWDMTNQRKAAWHRFGPYASAPSARLVRLIAAGHKSVINASNALVALAVRELHRPTCHVCGMPCKDGASRFCSRKCNKAWRGDRACKCGAIVQNATAFGLAPNCLACRRESRRIHKRMCGSYRKRCKTYGGFFNPTVMPKDVFVRDNWRCHVCGKKTAKVYNHHDPLSATVDHHPVPLSKGGDHDWQNVRCACKRCNELKGNKWDGQLRMRMAAGK
jgi:hypothetical protein